MVDEETFCYTMVSIATNKEYEMPNITIEAVKLSNENKVELIKELTKTASGITNIPESSFIVQIREFPMENWGIGGKTLPEIMNSK